MFIKMQAHTKHWTVVLKKVPSPPLNEPPPHLRKARMAHLWGGGLNYGVDPIFFNEKCLRKIFPRSFMGSRGGPWLIYGGWGSCKGGG